MGLEQLFAWPVVFFGLFVYFVTLAIRKSAKVRFHHIEGNEYWRGVVLPILPAAIGVLMTFLLSKGTDLKYPLPEIAVQSGWAKVLFGATTGFLSGSVYQIFKAVVKKTWGVDIGKSIPPPKDETPEPVSVTVDDEDTKP